MLDSNQTVTNQLDAIKSKPCPLVNYGIYVCIDGLDLTYNF